MKSTQQKVAENQLNSREDAVRAVLDMCEPLKRFYSEGKALLYVGDTAAHYGEKSARMEGWARMLWALGPLFAGENENLPLDMQKEIRELKDLYLTGLINGTNPSHAEYWGDIYDFDQKMVETAALAVSLSIAKDTLWEPLTKEQKDRVYHWMKGINEHGVHPNNWRFFRILTNMCFETLDLPFDTEMLEADFEIIENCYVDEGWYYDGHAGQMDYYIPFAMHFYALIWAKISKSGESEYKIKIKERAAIFAKDFIAWFADDGVEVPYGRSLTYRFAHSAFFSALAFADVEALAWGQVRRVVMQNLRQWFKLPIFDRSGVLTIGYNYPNLIMSERYNSPGSPYWGFKVFMFLALPDKHPFWQTKEEELPKVEKILKQKSNMLVVHDYSTKKPHIQIFVTGQHSMEHGNSRAKYEKFVYSNRMGFSISRDANLSGGAFDNTIAFSYDSEDDYRARYGHEKFEVTDEYIRTKYKIFPEVVVESIIIPLTESWHVRIHKVNTEKKIKYADGGFALSAQEPFTCSSGNDNGKYKSEYVQKEENILKALFPWGNTVAVSYTAGELQLVDVSPNTNLLVNLSVIPYVMGVLEVGESIIVNAFHANLDKKDVSDFENLPSVKLEGNVVEIKYKNLERRVII
jgi:Uncharacterized protein conserved in bacteria